jgi:hypothetical protein
LWVRGPARIERGQISLDPVATEEYYPFETTTLVFDLAAIRTADDAITFATRHGLLRCADLSGLHSEAVEEWFEEASDLRWILQLHTTLRRAVRGDSRAIERIWEFEPDFRLFFSESAPSDEEVLGQASLAIAWLVNDHLEGVREHVVAEVEIEATPGSDSAGSPGSFRISAIADTLLGYAYHHLLLTVVNRRPMIDCEECGRFFIVDDKRQRFCSAKCAGRARYRRWSAARAAKSS